MSLIKSLLALFVLCPWTLLAQVRIFDKLSPNYSYDFTLLRENEEKIEGQVQKKETSYYWDPQETLDPSILIQEQKITILDQEFEVATIWPAERLEGLDSFFQAWRFVSLYDNEQFAKNQGKVELLQETDQRYQFTWSESLIHIIWEDLQLQQTMDLKVFLQRKTPGKEYFLIPKDWEVEIMN